MILRILTILLKQLIAEGLITFNLDETQSNVNELGEQLAQSIAQKASSAQQGSQFSSWLSSQILESDLVEELYASDNQIYEILSNIEL